MLKALKFIILLLLVVIANLFGHHWDYDKKEVTSQEKTLTFTADKDRQITVDNIFGKVMVKGYNGNEVKMAVKKTILAESTAELNRAKQEVDLKIRTGDNHIRIIVDGPFRRYDGSINWGNRGYIVKYDFELNIPRSTGINLYTVNDGDITVDNVKGDFRVSNVNGRITLNNITGSGKATTVNGGIRVDFVENPSNDCSFHTVNGTLKLLFPKRPNADFLVKTFNGEVYSDFSVTYLPARAGTATAKRIHGKYVYKSDRFQGIRVGTGGREIRMDTLNGNIYIAKK